MFVSVIIPTYKRVDDLKKMLDSLSLQTLLPQETIIIDQSPDDQTKRLCNQKIYDNLHINYLWRDVVSSAQARNQGIDAISSISEIVCFFDDDVVLDNKYIEEIQSFFSHHLYVKGIGGYIINAPKGFFWRLFFLFRRFILGDSMNEDCSVLRVKKAIVVDSLVGCSMAYRKYIIDQGYKFPDWMDQYSYAEDLFFSSEIARDYPKSLWFLPLAKLSHYRTPTARIPSKEKIKQIMLHYFCYYFHTGKSLRYYIVFLTTFVYYLFSYRSPMMISLLFLAIAKDLFFNGNIYLKHPVKMNSFIFGK